MGASLVEDQPTCTMKNTENAFKDESHEIRQLTTTSEGSSDLLFDDSTTKRLMRKIDLRILPFLSLLYLLSFLDRTNIGNARLAGLEKDLGMSGLDYNVSVIALTLRLRIGPNLFIRF